MCASAFLILLAASVLKIKIKLMVKLDFYYDDALN